MPYSVYFKGDLNAADIVKEVYETNKLRFVEAIYFLKSLNISTLKQENIQDNLGEKVDLAIGIITINRDAPDIGRLGYLTQTLASVLHVLHGQTSGFRAMKHFICNVDKNPDRHVEAKRLSIYTNVVERHDINIPEGDDIFEKEKNDYVFCLEQAARYDPKYVLMLEDDVLLDENFLTTLWYMLKSRHGLSRSVNDVGSNQTKSTDNWLFIKMYYPLKWSGYSFEIDKVLELVGVALVGGSLFACMTLLLVSSHRTFRTAQVLFIMGTIFFAVAAYTMGRPYVESWKKYFDSTHRLVKAHGCCTQAVLYRTKIIAELCHHLHSVECTKSFSVDLAIDQFGVLQNLPSYSIEPNLCRHIGLVSTVRANAKFASEFLY